MLVKTTIELFAFLHEMDVDNIIYRYNIDSLVYIFNSEKSWMCGVSACN